eukprot:CAMPEP_0171857290 /NCGR_PEP_ID=MMETSP0992-20121227/24606_1 /TAXON_ID=483369 /ORGANISM="non described non described, Strain CCMP2098" /LENGTH=62 /DNA_ID=CAMNT_0012478507 /DNA_START=120 /DNA_END=304 /DNA_ORIENTATION=+
MASCHVSARSCGCFTKCFEHSTSMNAFSPKGSPTPTVTHARSASCHPPPAAGHAAAAAAAAA